MGPIWDIRYGGSVRTRRIDSSGISASWDKPSRFSNLKGVLAKRCVMPGVCGDIVGCGAAT